MGLLWALPVPLGTLLGPPLAPLRASVDPWMPTKGPVGTIPRTLWPEEGPSGSLFCSEGPLGAPFGFHKGPLGTTFGPIGASCYTFLGFGGRFSGRLGSHRT